MVLRKGSRKIRPVLKPAFRGEGFYGVPAPLSVFAKHPGYVSDPQFLLVTVESTPFMFPDDGGEVGGIGIESGRQFMKGHSFFEKEEVLFEGFQFREDGGGQLIRYPVIFRGSR